jgi:hypothetical protein
MTGLMAMVSRQASVGKRRLLPRLFVVATLLGSACGMVSHASAQYPLYRSRGYLPYGGRGFGMPRTALSAAQFGMARMIAASGYANLLNSRAARNYTAARAANIRNRALWTNSYYQMRHAHRAYESDRTHLTMDEITKIAQEAAPKRLDVTEIDSATGKIQWPIILQESPYASARDELDHLFQLRAVSAGPIDSDSYRDIHHQCEQLRAQLKANIKEYSARDFEQAKHFIDSLAYETRFPHG